MELGGAMYNVSRSSAPRRGSRAELGVTELSRNVEFRSVTWEPSRARRYGVEP